MPWQIIRRRQAPTTEIQDERLNRSGEPSEGMGRRVLSGLAWKGTSQVVAQAIQLGVAIALARLLMPHEYGMAGMLIAVSTFVLVSDLALGAILVQRQTLSQVECSTAFWTSIAAGIVFSAAIILLSGPISSFFREPTLAPMIRILALSFLLSSIALTQSALLVRAMAFRSLEIRQMATQIASGLAAITIAALGYGAWAIVAQQIVRATVSTALVWQFSSWRPSLEFSFSTLRGFAGFSGNVLGQNLLTQLRAISDNVLVGRVLGASALGAYALSYNLVLVPFRRIAVPLGQVLYPALARVQTDPELVRAYWLRSVRTLGAVAIPSLLGLIVLAPDFVRVVLGEKWLNSVTVIQLLTVVGLLQTLQFLNSAILQALDRTSVLFRWTLASYALTLTSFIIGLRWGIVGLAVAYAICSVITETLYAHLTSRILGSSVWTLLSTISGVVLSAAVMAIIVLALRILLQNEGVGVAVRLPLLVAVGAAVYAGLMFRFSPAIVNDFRIIARRGRSYEI